jgi:hypothetical protein
LIHPYRFKPAWVRVRDVCDMRPIRLWALAVTTPPYKGQIDQDVVVAIHRGGRRAVIPPHSALLARCPAQNAADQSTITIKDPHQDASASAPADGARVVRR